MSAEASRLATIVNARGLHARATAKFVKMAGGFDAELEVRRDGSTVDGRSMLGLMTLGAAKGVTIEIRARGPDAEAAVAALGDLVDRGFDE